MFFNTVLHELGHQIQFHSDGNYDAVPIGSKWFTEYGDPRVDYEEWYAEHFTLWAADPETYKAYDPIGFEHIDSMVKITVQNPNFKYRPSDFKVPKES